MENQNNYFAELAAIDVSDKIEKKNGLKYLSWAWAWDALKKKHPNATSMVYEDASGRNYHTDGKTCWVKTSVTVNGIEHIEYLPVMDHRNNSIPLERVTSVDVNKAIQRCNTKACARHGLGLYIYAGEDMPEVSDPSPAQPAAPAPSENRQNRKVLCPACRREVTKEEEQKGMHHFDAPLCSACAAVNWNRRVRD